MANFVTSVYPEQGGELFMEKDREYFREHPEDECYLRERFKGEPHNCPFLVPYMVVFNVGNGMRMRLPYQKSSLSIDDIEKLKRQYKKHLMAMRKLEKKGKISKSKSKGFGKKSEKFSK